nr:hypothetical protein [Bacteroidota bacterium]
MSILCSFKFLKTNNNQTNWSQITTIAAFKIWSGYAFENLCFKHSTQIKKALGISGVASNEYSYLLKRKGKDKGFQIDMIIDRADNCVNVLEAKFYNTEFEVTQAYARELLHKATIFTEKTNLNKNVFITMLSVFGVKKNEHYLSAVTNQLLIDDLFT